MMKRMLCVVLAALLLLFASVSLAATDDENKDKIMESLEKTVLSNHPAILKQVERILYMDALTVSDEQATELLALKLAQSDLTFVDKGTSLYDYTEQEQEIAIDYINRVCTILDISYTISPTNDKQSDNAVVISVYKDGKLLGDVHPDVWEVAGAVSPNPGGVGPLTRAFLVHNVVERAEKLAGL